MKPTIFNRKPAGKKPSPESADKKQKRKVVVFGCILFIPFAFCLYLIFGSNQTVAGDEVEGLNIGFPDAKTENIEGDKLKAVEIVEAEEKQRVRLRTLGENPLYAGEGTDNHGASDLTLDLKPAGTEPSGRQGPSVDESLARSQQAHRHMTSQANEYYSQTQRDPEVERLRREVAELKARQVHEPLPAAADPLQIMEQHYELAAKYFPGSGGPVKSVGTSDKASGVKAVGASRYASDVVSSLSGPAPDTLPGRNPGFVTAAGSRPVALSNAIRACVDSDQTISAGSRIKLRLLEPLLAGDILLPENSPIYGTASFSGHRLDVVITSIEWRGNIIPVNLTVHDMDGQQGLNVPDSTERTAAKDALGTVSQSLGTSISFPQSAGQQVVSDLSRGAITGGSQYLSSKLREVKITLKANYQLLLVSRQ